MTRPMTNSSTPIIHPVLATIVTIAKLRAKIQSMDNANVARYHFLKINAYKIVHYREITIISTYMLANLERSE